MRKTLLALYVGLLLSSVSPPANAQDMPPQLAKVAGALECLKKERIPAWSLERVPPFMGNENVLIVMWVSAGRRVKVSISPHPSEAAAAESIRRFASSGGAKKVQAVGDEAYAWGYGDDITLRQGSFTVSVSAVSDIDTLLPWVDAAERDDLRRAEQVALNKNFAKLMSAVLADPSAACGTYMRF